MSLSRRCLLLSGVAGVAGVAGCSLSPDEDHSGPDVPRAEPLRRPVRVAWALSSGGPRGFVHVGVLKALEELGLAPDLIVGASVGALVGSLRASGVSAREIEQLALELQPWTLGRLAVGAPERLSGSAVAALVRERCKVPLLEQMPVAMACVAQRRDEGSPVAFTAGDVGLAVQASAAIEGQFAPVRIRGQRFVDPDWSTPLPVRVARALGAQRVLAVDATAHVDRAPSGAERYRDSDLRKKALVDADGSLADLLLKPDFGYWVSLSREFRERAIGAGVPGDDGAGGLVAGAARGVKWAGSDALHAVTTKILQRLGSFSHFGLLAGCSDPKAPLADCRPTDRSMENAAGQQTLLRNIVCTAVVQIGWQPAHQPTDSASNPFRREVSHQPERRRLIRSKNRHPACRTLQTIASSRGGPGTR